MPTLHGLGHYKFPVAYTLQCSFAVTFSVYSCIALYFDTVMGVLYINSLVNWLLPESSLT